MATRLGVVGGGWAMAFHGEGVVIGWRLNIKQATVSASTTEIGFSAKTPDFEQN